MIEPLKSGLHVYVEKGCNISIHTESKIWEVLGGILTVAGVPLALASAFHWPVLGPFASNPATGIVLAFLGLFALFTNSGPLSITIYNPDFTATTYVFDNSQNFYQWYTWSIIIPGMP